MLGLTFFKKIGYKWKKIDYFYSRQLGIPKKRKERKAFRIIQTIWNSNREYVCFMLLCVYDLSFFFFFNNLSVRTKYQKYILGVHLGLFRREKTHFSSKSACPPFNFRLFRFKKYILKQKQNKNCFNIA